MKALSKNQIIEMNKYISRFIGGSGMINDENEITAAIDGALADFYGKELYPTAEEKASVLGCALIKGNAFVDGNSQTGICTMLTFLEMNGIKLRLTDKDIVEITNSIKSGKYLPEDVLNWIKSKRYANG